MPSLNKVLLMGNLTREPELRYIPGSNAAVCEFGIAINRRYMTANGQERDETCFVDIVVWGKQAESCSRFLQKGAPVFIEGRLNYEQWVEKDSQKKRSRLRVSADRVQFIGARREDGVPEQGPDAGQSYGAAPQGGYAPRQQQYSRPAAPQGQGYRSQSFDNPPPRSYGNPAGGYGVQTPQSVPAAEQPAFEQAAPRPAMQEPPAMPDADPLEDVDDIPF